MTGSANRFDQIDNYDDEIPRHVAAYLNEVKTAKNARVIRQVFGEHSGLKGIDLGCGTGEHANSLQQRCPGIVVDGLDNSARQIELARTKGFNNTFLHCSMTQIDAPDESYDFAYAINSMHHLPSTQAQVAAFNEVRRILRPGGVFILHEMNTTNPLIRFYLKHLFPRLRRIDDGSEIWLTPARVSESGFRVESVEHFTFVPDFTPRFAMRVAVPIDRFLSRTPLARFGAHVMYVLKKE